MAVRAFNASTDELRFTPGGANIDGGPITIAMLVKRTVDNTWDALLASHNSSGVFQGWAFEARDNTDVTNGRNGLAFFTTTPAGNDYTVGTRVIWPVSDGWCVIVVTKAAGTQAPKYHKYPLSAAAWTRSSGTTAIGDGIAPGSGGSIKMGLLNTSDDPAAMRVAVAGVWATSFSDAQVDELVAHLKTSDWANHSAGAPVALWELNQAAVTTSVPDLIGTSSQSARTGTTVVTGDDPSGWTFDGIGGGSSVALTGTSAGTSTSTGTLTLVVAVAGTSTGTSISTGSASLASALSGTSNSTSTSSGALSATRSLTASSASTSTTAGDVNLIAALGGNSAGTSTSAADLSAAWALAGTSTGASSTQGDLAGGGTVPLTGASTGASASSGDLSVARPLAGASTGTSTTTGDVSLIRGLGSTSAGLSTTTGALITATSLTGTSQGASTSSGGLRSGWALAGVSTGLATTAGTLTVQGQVVAVGALEGSAGASFPDGSTHTSLIESAGTSVPTAE